MYQPHYSGYQPMRPPTHPGAPPPLHIQTSTPPQSRYSPYGMTTSRHGSMPLPSPPPPQPQQYPQQAATLLQPQQQQQPQPPPSPSEQSERHSEEEDFSSLRGPPPTSHVWDGYIWALEVVQHPQRARMCGFGDKDRRPISPPPCIRLIIMDPNTGKEIDYTELELTHLVLTVDIWDIHGQRELNLVKQSNASPCISSAATGSFPVTSQQVPSGHQAPQPYDTSRIPGYAQSPVLNGQNHGPHSNGNGIYPTNGQSYQNGHSYQNGTAPYSNGHHGHTSPYQNGTSHFRSPSFPYSDSRYSAPHTPQYGNPGTALPGQVFMHPPPHASSIPSMSVVSDQSYLNAPNPTTQLYTRNLIGSLCASAFKLRDEKDVLGIWFVLQDLSVRTEGWFRLKMNFFNLAQAVENQINDITNGPAEDGRNSPAKTTAPCLASIFSNPFKVFSAKKFPGVVESTPLSKAFAHQGIKIPIRKDTGGKRGKDDGSDDGEGSGADE